MMTSMAVAAAQNVAATSFAPYSSSSTMAARLSLSADTAGSSHAMTGNPSHRQGQQNSLRGASFPASHTPPPRGLVRNSVQTVEPLCFVQNDHANAALMQQKFEADRLAFGVSPRPPFDDAAFHPSFPDSSDFGVDFSSQLPQPVHSRYFAPFPGSSFRNDAAYSGEAALRNERIAEDYARMVAYRRDQEFDRAPPAYDIPAPASDLSAPAYEHLPSVYVLRPKKSFYVDEEPSTAGRPDAFASLNNRLNSLARNQNRAAALDFNHRQAANLESSHRQFEIPQPQSTRPFNAALAGIVESLERSLALSPPGECVHEWGVSPRGHETPRYRREGRNGKPFESFRDLDDVLPNGRQVDPTRVMVSGISWQMSAHQIRDELVHRCSKLGKVVDIEVAQYRGNSPSQLDRGRHRGFAFVTMETPEQASLVMAALHKMDMGGMQVQTKPGVVKDPMFARRNYAKKKAEEVVHKPSGRKHVKVFVGNLWFGTDSERLREAFQDFGMVVDTKVVRDKDSGESRGFGFVTFANEASAIDAIGARDGSLLDGRKLVVNVSRSWAGSTGEEESGSEGSPSSPFLYERH